MICCHSWSILKHSVKHKSVQSVYFLTVLVKQNYAQVKYWSIYYCNVCTGCEAFNLTNGWTDFIYMKRKIFHETQRKPQLTLFESGLHSNIILLVVWCLSGAILFEKVCHHSPVPATAFKGKSRSDKVSAIPSLVLHLQWCSSIPSRLESVQLPL